MFPDQRQLKLPPDDNYNSRKKEKGGQKKEKGGQIFIVDKLPNLTKRPPDQHLAIGYGLYSSPMTPVVKHPASLRKNI
jgi:hypothetical protein